MVDHAMEPLSAALDPGDERAEARQTLRTWLALQWALALRPAQAVELLKRTRDPGAALRQLARSHVPSPAELEAALARLAPGFARAVPYLSEAYPPRLQQLPDAAPLLWVRGDLDAVTATSVAIVGARAPSAYGLRVARELARDLASEGLVIVSGLARGIDAAAHRGALEAGGRTVAVQACGPDRVYPRAHRGLADQIAAHGALLSELPPGTAALPMHFPLRNRLISGLAHALVVVEARERSGSLITVGHALDQDVAVFAVPGPIVSPTSAGTNRMLRDGAHVALSADDVLGILGRARTRPVERRPRGGARISTDARTLFAALNQAPATRDELARRLARSPEQLALALLELELAGCVSEDRDGRVRVVSRLEGPEL